MIRNHPDAVAILVILLLAPGILFFQGGTERMDVNRPTLRHELFFDRGKIQMERERFRLERDRFREELHRAFHFRAL